MDVEVEASGELAVAGGFFPRRKFRDALMAILEDEDGPDEELVDEEGLLEALGEESVDEDEDDPTVFGQVSTGTSDTLTTSSSTSASSGQANSDSPLAEIYAQEYKARNRVREIKKMRQYFQREAGGQQGNTKDREHVKRWVKEQQKTEPCFICRQLGHWSQECPFRHKAPIHASNVTFQTSTEPNWDLLQQCVVSPEAYKESTMSNGVEPDFHVHHQLAVNNCQQLAIHEVCWSLQELGDKMILDLGCMKTVAGTTWINPIVRQWKRNNRFVKVIPEEESFRFGDGHINKSRFAVILEVMIATIPCALRISVVGGDCPPLLSKPVCTALGLVVDTASHVVSSKKFGVKAYGLKQSQGGHYLLPIAQFEASLQVPPDLHVPSHLEVMPLRSSGSDTIPVSPHTNVLVSAAPSHAEPVFDTSGRAISAGEPMGKRGYGCGRERDGRRDGGGGPQGHAEEAQGEDNFAEEAESGPSHAGILSCDAIPDADDAADVPTDAGHDGEAAIDAGEPTRLDEDIWNSSAGRREEEGEQVEQAEQACGTHRRRGAVSIAVQDVLHGRDIQCGQERLRPERDVQMEDPTSHAADEEGCRAGQRQTVEEELQMADAHGGSALGQPMGTPGVGQATVFQPQDLLPGGGRRSGQAGAAERELNEDLVDPNAPTPLEQRRRAEDRIDVVQSEGILQGVGLLPGVIHPSEVYQQVDPRALCGAAQTLHQELPAHHPPHEPPCEPAVDEPRSKITLNRRQTRTIRQGVEKALRTHKKIFEVSQMKGRYLCPFWRCSQGKPICLSWHRSQIDGLCSHPRTSYMVWICSILSMLR